MWTGVSATTRGGGSSSLKSTVACGNVGPMWPDLSIFQKKLEIQIVCVCDL